MEYDEERRNREPIPEESDDVNGLSMSVDQQSSSYLGASSIKAAFLVMLRVAPSLKGYLGPPTGVNRQQLLGQVEHSSLPRQQYNRPAKPQQKISWSSEGQTLIDAYFNRVHLFIPMLDEPSFRRNYLGSERDDAPWLALLNMVFAMGSMAANKSDDHTHLRYYEQAKGLLDLDSLGSGHLETLQALGIMGGYYLHYINRPNMAHAVMGAALRMATALGLHKEVPGSVSTGGENDSSAKGRCGNSLDGTNGISPDIRRRTWWSLFCLDTWASTTLGRPSMRWSKAVTILPPQEDEEKVSLAMQNGHMSSPFPYSRLSERSHRSSYPICPFTAVNTYANLLKVPQTTASSASSAKQEVLPSRHVNSRPSGDKSFPLGR